MRGVQVLRVQAEGGWELWAPQL